MKITAIFILVIVASTIHSVYGQTTYTGLFYASDGMGMHTDQWLNLIPNSGATSANYWNVYHKDGGSILQVHFGAAQPFVQVGLSRTTNFFVNGNVGIGTTSPSGLLHVAGLNGNAWSYFAGNINGAGNPQNVNGLALGWNKSGGAGESIVTYNTSAGSNPRLDFASFNGTTFSTEMTLLGGKLAIGTNSPYQWSKLHIKAPGANPWGIMAEANSNDKVVALGHDGTSGVISVSYLSSAGWSPLLFRTQNVTRMTIGVDGNVGIGTASPIEKLTVNGTIYGKEVKVDLSVPGPDYVFDEDYQLTPLEDIKTYIDKNKHLPEVPSAKEMEKNGIQLGEMNMLLLKKIEELTLYVINLKQEIETLKKSKK